jgi:hypothetical protein
VRRIEHLEHVPVGVDDRMAHLAADVSAVVFPHGADRTRSATASAVYGPAYGSVPLGKKATMTRSNSSTPADGETAS